MPGMVMSFAEIARACGGELRGRNLSRSSAPRGISTDSRKLKRGDLYVALRGERYDGHQFIKAAVEQGATGVVAAKVSPALRSWMEKRGTVLIQVDDTLKALQEIAGEFRRLCGARVIAITGSFGKTLTKDFLASILSRRHRVIQAEKSFNNEVGVPLTLLKIRKDTEFAVVEMGSRGFGHLRDLVRFSRPDIGVVTGIGHVHMQFFRTLEGVARAKGELLEGLPEDGCMVINRDDPFYKYLRNLNRCGAISFGLRSGAAVRAREVKLDGMGHASFVLELKGGDSRRVRLPLPGRHNVINALAAAAGAVAAGATLEEIAEGLREAKLTEWRMEMITKADDITIINDAYNANPASMQAALETMRDIAQGRRTVAVLGEMAELGSFSEEAHRRVGEQAVEYGTDILIAVGRKGRIVAKAAREKGLPKGSVFFASSVEDAAFILRAIIEPGDVVLIKGSRFLGMEKLADLVA